MRAPPGGVLALDLSSMTGWCYGDVDGLDPHGFGCWQLPVIGGEGARYAAFEDELYEAIGVMQPSALLLEAPLSLAALLGHSTFRAVSQQLTLRGLARTEAYRASIPVTEVGAEKVRLAMLGQARFAKGAVKKAVWSYCRARGWKVRDHNAADACLTWAWHAQQMRGARPAAGPLFATAPEELR